MLNDTIYKLPTDDEETWDTICEGDTKGIFQLESRLCKHWSKEAQPRSIEELSDLISIVRPGTLEAKSVDKEGKVKSLTQIYCDRKRGLIPVEYISEAVEPVLNTTYGIIVYQEQAMRLAQLLAGFNLVQADTLRKAIGTKDPVIMDSLEKTWLDGCRRIGKVDDEIAIEIFENIRKSSRYSFNLSHGVSYAYITYWTAYLKTHYLIDFYTEYLNSSKDKQKPKIEVKELIEDARHHDINTRMTTLHDLQRDGETKFYHKNNEILFGVQHVKGVGVAHIKGLLEKVKHAKNWMDILECKMTKTLMTNLTSAGFFDCLNLSRKEKLYEYNIYNKLSAREKELARVCDGSLREKLEYVLPNVNVNRKEIINNLLKTIDHPPYSLVDDPSWLYDVELDLLGICLNFHKTDISGEVPSALCREILDGKTGDCTLILEITEPKEYKIKRGKSKGNPMASFNGSDATGEIQCLAFSETWTENKHKLYPGAVIFVSGALSKNGGFVINKIK